MARRTRHHGAHHEGRGDCADDYTGDVIGDLNARRGQIQGTEALTGSQQINAFVPPCRTCSVTLPTCAARPRAAASIPWTQPLCRGSQEYCRGHYGRPQEGLSRGRPGAGAKRQISLDFWHEF